MSAPDPRIIEETLAEIGRTRMPFGKFGPGKFSPHGVPIYDLPAEYLGWFALKGFPKGRIGELLRMVYEAKAAGADTIFDALRTQAGGRTRFRPGRQREWEFG